MSGGKIVLSKLSCSMEGAIWTAQATTRFEVRALSALHAALLNAACWCCRVRAESAPPATCMQDNTQLRIERTNAAKDTAQAEVRQFFLACAGVV